MELNFKLFMEMPHIAVRKNGLPKPFPFEGKYVKFIDFKFETYPPGSPEIKLSGFGSKFYGKLPGSHLFLIVDFPSECYASNDAPEDNYLKLRDDWADYATFLFMDGSIREPKDTREEPDVMRMK